MGGSISFSKVLAVSLALSLGVGTLVIAPTIADAKPAVKASAKKATPAKAEPASQVEDYAFDKITQTLSLEFSSPLSRATLIPIYDKGARTLFLDIRGASLEGFTKKEAFSQDIPKWIPGVEKAVISEFRSNPAIVRIWIKLSNLDNSAIAQLKEGKTRIELKIEPTAKMEADAKTLRDKGLSFSNMLPPSKLDPKLTPDNSQNTIGNHPEANGTSLISIAPSSQSVPAVATSLESKVPLARPEETSPPDVLAVPAKLDKPALLSDTSYSMAYPAAAQSQIESDVAPINGQTDINTRIVRKKVAEADSLRKERDVLSSENRKLKMLVVQRDEVIAKLKREQQLLLEKDSDISRKTRIEKLQFDLTQLQKSADQLERDNKRLMQENKGLASQINQIKQSQLALGDQQAQASAAVVNPMPSAKVRGSYINTLSQLTKAELDQLVDAEALYRDGRKAEIKGDVSTAETRYRAALKLAPQVSEYSLALSSSLMAHNQLDGAKNVLQEALRYQPNDKALQSEMGKVYLLESNVSAALELLRKALPVDTLSNFASALRRAHKMDEAEAILKAVITAQPSDSDLHYNLGSLYLSQKRFNSAQNSLQEAVKLKPDFAEAHYQLGLTYAELGNVPDAISELDRYLQLMPSAPNSQSVRKYIDDLMLIKTPGKAPGMISTQ